MELYHLKTFVTVAEEGHLTRAADRLYTSQPAISAHIKALEEELGITLFHRTPKGMQLTVEGEQLLPRAQQALAAANEFQQFAKGMQEELVGSVRIGLNNDAEFLRLPSLQHQLSTRHARLELHFLSGMSETNIHNVRTGRMDAAFFSGECNDPQIEYLRLTDVSLRVAAPISWRDRISSTSIEALASLPWVYTSPNCVYFRAIGALFDAHNYQPEKTVSSDQEDAVHSMIKAGVGVGIMREDEALLGEKEGHLYVLPVELPQVELGFIYLKKRTNDPVIRAICDELMTSWGIQQEQQKKLAI